WAVHRPSVKMPLGEFLRQSRYQTLRNEAICSALALPSEHVEGDIHGGSGKIPANELGDGRVSGRDTAGFRFGPGNVPWRVGGADRQSGEAPRRSLSAGPRSARGRPGVRRSTKPPDQSDGPAEGYGLTLTRTGEPSVASCREPNATTFVER